MKRVAVLLALLLGFAGCGARNTRGNSPSRDFMTVVGGAALLVGVMLVVGMERDCAAKNGGRCAERGQPSP